jgi:drug/metabolite transporter (DMT)-like permease
MTDARARTAYALLGLCVLFWSGNVITARALREQIPPFTLSFWRWFLAFAVLLPWVARDLRTHWRDVRAGWRNLIPAGVLGMGAYSSLVYLGLRSTTATNAALINATVPVLIAALSSLLYRHRLTWRQRLGVVFSLAGVALIVLQAGSVALQQLTVNAGDLWIFLAVIGFVIYTVCFRRTESGLAPGAYLAVTIGIAAAGVAPFHAWEIGSGVAVELTAAAVAGVVYLAIFPSILSYLFWIKGVEAVGPARAGMVLYLMPVFTTVLAVCFLDERLNAFHGIGAALIVGGIWLTAAGSATREGLPERKTAAVVPPDRRDTA